jgi:hypothetical protein
MFDIDNPHQAFQVNDDNNRLICRWSMDKINRQTGPIWVMNHLFINPDVNSKQILHDQMKVVMEIAQKSQIPVWPLDPQVIAYFSQHSEFDKIWYHKPYSK